MPGLLAGCGGEPGIKVTGHLTLLSPDRACIESPAPDDPRREQCFDVDEDTEVRPTGVETGDFVTIRAQKGDATEIHAVDAPE